MEHEHKWHFIKITAEEPEKIENKLTGSTIFRSKWICNCGKPEIREYIE